MTLTQAKLFQEECPLHNEILELLQAHCVFWKSEKPVYCAGTSYVAGMLLVCMPAQDAFLCLVNVINKSLLKAFYYGTQEDVSMLGTILRKSTACTNADLSTDRSILSRLQHPHGR